MVVRKQQRRRERLKRAMARLGQKPLPKKHIGKKATPQKYDYTSQRMLKIGVPEDKIDEARKLFGTCPKSDCAEGRIWKDRVRAWWAPFKRIEHFNGQKLQIDLEPANYKPDANCRNRRMLFE